LNMNIAMPSEEDKTTTVSIPADKIQKFFEIIKEQVDILGTATDELRQKNYAKAEQATIEAISIARHNGLVVALRDVYGEASSVEMARGDQKRYVYYERLRDSLDELMLNDKVLKNTKDIEGKYALHKKQAEIDVLNGQEKVQQLTLRQRMTTIWGLAALVLGIVLTGFFYYRNYQYKKRLLVTNGLLQEQRILELEHREREALLERATRDALTGLWNRATILEFLTGELEKARKHDAALAVAVIDVDFFKHINDTFGHAGGDEVLKELARRLRATLRQCDFVGRYGGEELLVVMPGLALEDRGNLMDALRANICATPFRVGAAELRVTVSVGGAWMDSLLEVPDELIRRADAALYEAKAAGRNRVICSTGSTDGTMLEVTASRRYLQDFIDRVKREAGKRGLETESN